MKTAAALFCVLFLADSVPAQGVYNMAKQQAKNAAASESRNQQAIDPSGQSPSAPPAQNNQQPDPALQATLQNISNLRADFDDLGSGRTNTVPLQNDLTTAAQGARPSTETVTKLAEDLAAAVSGNKKLQAQQQKLAQFCHALFNSSHLSAAQQQSVLDAVKKILSEGGVSEDDVTKVIADLKAVATATK
jgi:flagellar motor protein MotB